MTYPLSKGARAWQEKVRKFVDEELIPWEVEAEMNGGLLPKKVRAEKIVLESISFFHSNSRRIGLSKMTLS